mgnify:CR=1 FL=1
MKLALQLRGWVDKRYGYHLCNRRKTLNSCLDSLTAFKLKFRVLGWVFDQIKKTAARYSAARETLTYRSKDIGQPIGSIAGSRVMRDGMWFRLRQATIDPGSIQITAEGDTIGDDLNDYIPDDMTIDEFNDMWDGKTFDDFNVAPLTNGA